MNSKNIPLILGLIIGLPLALVMGKWVVSDQETAIVASLGIIVILVTAAMGRNLWILAVGGLALEGGVNALPVPFSLRDMLIGYVCAYFIFTEILSRRKWNFKFGSVEMVLGLLFLCILQSFLRNPAGVAALGFANVGGKPNFEMAFSFFFFLLLATRPADTAKIGSMFLFLLVCQFFSAGLLIVGNFVPVAGLIIFQIYQIGEVSGIASAGALVANNQSVGRLSFLRQPAISTWSLAVSLCSPLKLLNPFHWAPYVAILSVVMALYTGFRSVLVFFFLALIFSALVSRKKAELTAVGMAAIVFLVILVAGNNLFFTLPLQAQRALSFLPGDWDSLAVSDADGSSEWRYEMWREALFSDQYIKSKILGDGYIISKDVFAYKQLLGGGGGGLDSNQLQEYYLIIGNYHSGPIETIRRIGYVGLFFLLIAQVVIFRRSYRVTRLYRSHPAGRKVLFLMLPSLVSPFFFWIVIGSLQGAVLQLCVAAGLIRYLETALNNEYAMEAEENERHNDLAAGGQSPQI